MKKMMKRKQFHLTIEDNQLLKELSETKGLAEAEIVREAIREYGAKNMKVKNPLLEMAIEAEKNQSISDTPGDLAKNHDLYLLEILENEKK